MRRIINNKWLQVLTMAGIGTAFLAMAIASVHLMGQAIFGTWGGIWLLATLGFAVGGACDWEGFQLLPEPPEPCSHCLRMKWKLEDYEDKNKKLTEAVLSLEAK